MKLTSGSRSSAAAGWPSLAQPLLHPGDEHPAPAQPEGVAGAAEEAGPAAVHHQVHEAQHLVDVPDGEPLVQPVDRRLEVADDRVRLDRRPPAGVEPSARAGARRTAGRR